MNIQMITASTTMNQLQKKVDTISHNIANVSTTGYKRREATFQEALTQNIKNQPHGQKEMARQTPYGIRVGHGAILGQTTMRYEQGSMQVTDRPLDFMLEGEKVWFRTMRTWTDEDGNPREELLYTRDGSFQLTPDQDDPTYLRLTTAQGLTVLDDLELPIQILSNYERIEMSEEGVLRVYYPGFADQPEEYALNIVQMNRPDLFEGVGENQFRLPGELADHEANDTIFSLDLQGADRGTVKVRQGALEMSNVDLTTEMTELMTTQRLMQFQSRSISMADEMMGLANSIRG